MARRKVSPDLMDLDQSYRLLDLDRRASDEALKAAHRDLTKVWHPDRFAHDAGLRRKAEEKLKAINEAYDTIREARAGGETAGSPSTAPRGGELMWRYRFWSLFLAASGLFFLFRRPSLAGLVIGLALLAAAFVLVRRMRDLARK